MYSYFIVIKKIPNYLQASHSISTINYYQYARRIKYFFLNSIHSQTLYSRFEFFYDVPLEDQMLLKENNRLFSYFFFFGDYIFVGIDIVNILKSLRVRN